LELKTIMIFWNRSWMYYCRALVYSSRWNVCRRSVVEPDRMSWN